MKRTKLKDRVLPTYSKGEEIFNMVSHIVGGGLGVLTLIIGIIISIIHKNIYGGFSVIIFSISMSWIIYSVCFMYIQKL